MSSNEYETGSGWKLEGKINLSVNPVESNEVVHGLKEDAANETRNGKVSSRGRAEERRTSDAKLRKARETHVVFKT